MKSVEEARVISLLSTFKSRILSNWDIGISFELQIIGVHAGIDRSLDA
jgi:hypothetical protein